MSHSLDLRKKVVELYQENPCFRAVGKILRLPHATVRNLVSLWRNTGTLEPQYQNCGRTPTIKEQEKQWLRQWLGEDNGLTLQELAGRLAERGVAVSHSTVDNALKAMRITRKKNDRRRRAQPSGRAGKTWPLACGGFGRGSGRQAGFP